MENRSTARELIDALYEDSPELFPLQMEKGYQLNGKSRKSKKSGLQLRKIKISGKTYRIRPSFLMSYHRGKVEEIAKGLFLIRFGKQIQSVCFTFWTLAFVFGRYAMWWYRAYISLNDTNLVATTVYNPYQLPQDLIADEHHIKIKDKKAYVATTVGEGCFLGMQASPKADEVTLRKAYGVFQAEALALDPDYQPDSVNADGWKATQNA